MCLFHVGGEHAACPCLAGPSQPYCSVATLSRSATPGVRGGPLCFCHLFGRHRRRGALECLTAGFIHLVGRYSGPDGPRSSTVVAAASDTAHSRSRAEYSTSSTCREGAPAMPYAAPNHAPATAPVLSLSPE